MASVAQLGLVLHQQQLLFFGVMRIVAVETADIAAGVGGFGEVGLLMSFAVAAQTASASLLARLPLEHEYLAFVAATRHMVRPGTMTALATLFRGAALSI
jgi:hypothetical protein